jgi:Fe2+ or Zn2+ uptake regulation protein
MLNEIITRLRYIDILIRENKTGNAEDLAVVVGVSVRTVYKYLDLMKRLGAPIAFNASSRTYYYKTEGSLECTFTFKANNEQLQNSGTDKAKLSLVSMQEFLQQMNKGIINYN